MACLSRANGADCEEARIKVSSGETGEEKKKRKYVPAGEPKKADERTDNA